MEKSCISFLLCKDNLSPPRGNPIPDCPLLCLAKLCDPKSIEEAKSPRVEKVQVKKERPNPYTPYVLAPNKLNTFTLIQNLRQDAYTMMYSSSLPTCENSFPCIFSGSCDKVLTGKGNLRKHVEW